MADTIALDQLDRPLRSNCWDARPDTLADVARLPVTPLIMSNDARPAVDTLVLWDVWPVQLDNGDVAPIAGGDLWVVLSAPRTGDPDERHDIARMRLFHRVAGQWRDCGNVLPDGFAPGKREWSGAARLEPDGKRITLWFTATGRDGNPAPDFEQRLFHTVGTLDLSGNAPRITDWRDLTQTVINDGTFYADLAINQGVPGRIKGLRDPYWFRDPADGQGYILFTGSKSETTSRSQFDGVIGIARATDADGLAAAELMAPLIDADGQVNELERPHIFVHKELYYLFWSSHRHVFAPGGLEGPTGLYGMVAPSLFGPWEPLNGSGLVLTNPPSAPQQAYAWQVTPDLEVVSFVDFWGLEAGGETEDRTLRNAHFGGTFAPSVRLAIDGKTTCIVNAGV